MPDDARDILSRGNRVEMTASGRATFIRRPQWRTLAGTVRDVTDDGYTVWVKRDGHANAQKWAASHWQRIGPRTHG